MFGSNIKYNISILQIKHTRTCDIFRILCTDRRDNALSHSIIEDMTKDKAYADSLQRLRDGVTLPWPSRCSLRDRQRANDLYYL